MTKYSQAGISKKITPKLYKLKDTEIYVFFSFSTIPV